MTGPAHYREAERLLQEEAVEVHGRVFYPGGGSTPGLLAAQVHATLALTAATAFYGYTGGSTRDLEQAWREVTS